MPCNSISYCLLKADSQDTALCITLPHVLEVWSVKHDSSLIASEHGILYKSNNVQSSARAGLSSRFTESNTLLLVLRSDPRMFFSPSEEDRRSRCVHDLTYGSSLRSHARGLVYQVHVGNQEQHFHIRQMRVYLNRQIWDCWYPSTLQQVTVTLRPRVYPLSRSKTSVYKLFTLSPIYL